MKITIIGAGNAGFAAAVFFQQSGADVLVYTRDNRKAELFEKTDLETTGVYNSNIRISVTSDLEKAAAFGDYLVIITWANAHKAVFRSLRGLIKERQKILIFNGNWGAYEGAKYLGKELREKQALLAETTSQVFLAGFTDWTHLEIKAVKPTLSLSGLNQEHTKVIAGDMRNFFQTVNEMRSVVASSLSAGNPIIHVPLMLFNLVRVENGEQFLFLGESSPKAVEYIERIDRERIQIGEKLGLTCRPILEELNSFWENKYDTLYDVFHKNPAYRGNLAPVSLTHRFITEDLPYGIRAVNQLGRLFGVGTPYADAAERIMCLYLQNDFAEEKVEFERGLLIELAEGKWG